MTKVGPEISPFIGGEVGGEVGGQADELAVLIKLDAQRLADLLTYCQEPKKRTEWEMS